MSAIEQIAPMSRPLIVSDGIHACAARHARKDAIRFEGRVRSYGELSNRIRRVAGGLAQCGLVKGDRVALLAPNCLEYAEIVVGCADAGLVVATLNARSTSAEIAAACNDCRATVLLVHPGLADVAGAACCPRLSRTIIMGAEYEAWLTAAKPAGIDAGLSEWDPFTLVYSSGTTGKPKGILLSHRARVLLFHGMAMEFGCYGPDDMHLALAPMAHGAGCAFVMAALYFGGTVELLAKFDPAAVVARLAHEPFTGVFLVPTHFHSIFAQESAVLERYRGQSRALQTIVSGAAALPQVMKEQIIDYWGPQVLHETYGSTEAGIVTNLRPRDQLTKCQSVGPAFGPTFVKIVDDAGEMVEPGMTGELYSSSPYLFSGYFEQPDATTTVIRDGFVTAGDLARQDQDGFLYIVDRKKDMVVTGGINVYPREVEEVLHTHPAVLDAAVVGIPDEQWGESLRAFVVVRQGMHVTGAELMVHCRSILAGYKVPKQFIEIAALPRNAGGKVLKNVLRSQV